MAEAGPMKRYAFTAAAGLVFVALLAYVLASGGLTPATGPSLATVLSVRPDQVRAIVIEQGGKTAVRLERQGDQWQIVEPRRVATSSAAVEGLLAELSPLEARRIIAQSPSDPGAYGLEQPKAVLSLAMADGSARRLAVGDETPLSQGVPAYYALGDDGASVYTIDAFVAEQLTGSWDRFRERSLVPFAPDDVERLRIEPKGGRAIEVRRSPGEDPASERRWRLRAPFEAPAQAATVEDVLRDLQFAQVSEFVDDEPSRSALEEYGLVEPEAAIRITARPGPAQQVASGSGGISITRVLLVGGSGPDGARYVQIEGEPSVYTVLASDVQEALSARPEAWVRQRVLGLARDEIERLSVRMTGRPGPVTLEQDGRGGWQLDPPRTDVSQEDVERLFDALSGLQADRVVAVGRTDGASSGNAGAGSVSIELIVAGHEGVPVTRVVFPVSAAVAAMAGELEPATRAVYVEQGGDHLTYSVQASALQEVEAIVAQWTAPDSERASTSGAR